MNRVRAALVSVGSWLRTTYNDVRRDPEVTTLPLLVYFLFITSFLACVSDWYISATPGLAGGRTISTVTLFFIESCTLLGARSATLPSQVCARTYLTDVPTSFDWQREASGVAFAFLFMSLLVQLVVLTAIGPNKTSLPDRVRSLLAHRVAMPALLATVWMLLLISWASFAGVVNAHTLTSTRMDALYDYQRFGGGFTACLMAWMATVPAAVLAWRVGGRTVAEAAGPADAAATAATAAAAAEIPSFTGASAMPEASFATVGACAVKLDVEAASQREAMATGSGEPGRGILVGVTAVPQSAPGIPAGPQAVGPIETGTAGELEPSQDPMATSRADV